MAIVITLPFNNTTGSTIALPTFDSRWATLASNQVYVDNTDDRAQAHNNSLGDFVYRFTDAAVPTGDQELNCDCGVSSEFSQVGVIGRMSASADTGYFLRIQPIPGASGELSLHRRVAGVNTQLAAGATVILDSVAYNITLTITGTNPVLITAELGGVTEISTFSDSGASRIQSGGTCIGGLWASDFGPAWIDNLTIDDLAGGGGGTPQALETTGTVPVQGAATLAVQKPLTTTGTVAAEGAHSLRVEKALATTGQVIPLGTAALSVGKPLESTGTVATQGTVTIGGVVQFALTGTVQAEGAAALQAGKLLSVSGLVTAEGLAELRAVRALASTGTVAAEGQAQPQVAKPLQSTGTVQTEGTSTLGGGVQLSLTGTVEAQASAELQAAKRFTTSGVVQVSGGVVLLVEKRLAVDGQVLVDGSATFSGPTPAIMLPGNIFVFDRPPVRSIAFQPPIRDFEF